MHAVELVLLLLVATVALTAFARRIRVPYPALLSLLGAALVFLPGVPHFQMEPALALTILVAPVLLDAAFDSSPRDLLRSWAPIAGLVFGAVCATVLAVACVVEALMPGLPWSAAIALGAIVAPPDAAAATAVLKQAPPPSRILRILEGESLLNDVTALLIYRLAVVSQGEAAFRPASAAATLALVVVGSLVAGVLFAKILSWLMRRVEDAPSSIVLQFVSTFGVWIAAERIGLSGILTMVVFAISIARRSGRDMVARVRVPTNAVWETAVFVLNSLAFVLIGLQLGPILDRLSGAERLADVQVALAVLATCVAVRFAWVLLYATVTRLACSPGERPLPRRGAFIVAWCGMRGIVTLAAALALPEGEHPFPGRDMILLTAFVVVLGTLVVQGLTLGPLLRRFGLRDDGLVAREVADARAAVRRAAHEVYRRAGTPVAAALLERDDDAAARALPETDALKRQAFDAARTALDELRGSEAIGNDAFRAVQVELDRTELMLDAKIA